VDPRVAALVLLTPAAFWFVPAGFARVAVHRAMGAEVTAFLDRTVRTVRAVRAVR
jgi:hypothetical protein